MSTILFIVVVELALNIVEPDLYYKNQFFPQNRDIDFPDIYKKDSRLFWRFRPGVTTESKLFSDLTYHINSQGRRGPETAEPKPGYRIVALGNSCTFGWGVSYENTWTRELQRLLNQQVPGRDFEVINAGIPGYSSHQGSIYLTEELLALKPDMVLIMFGWNDHFPAGHGITDAEQRMGNPLFLELQNLFSQLRLYQLLRKLVLSISEEETPTRLDDLSGLCRVPLRRFFENLKSITRTARQHGLQPVLLVPPVASLKGYFEGTVSNFHRRHELYQQEVVKVSQYESVSLVNLQDVFDRYNTLFANAAYDPIHFNEQGHRITAEAIAETIVALTVSK